MMGWKKLVAGFLSSVMFIWSPATAGEIDSVLNGLVTYQKVDPHVIKSGGYRGLTGGKFRFRLNTNLLNLPVFTINPPRATLSCSGLDLDAGLISWMNLETFEQLLEQGGASLAWGVMLGLIYSIPGVADAFTRLNKMGRMVQTLGQNACEMGKAMGTTFGNMLFETEKSKALDDGLGSNLAATTTEVLKRYKEALRAKNFYYYFPYTYLKTQGADEEITNLLAAFFGVYGWRAFKEGSSSDLCDSVDCLKPDNIKPYIYPPKFSAIEEILYPDTTNGGKTIKLPNCEWGAVNVQGATTVDTCTDVKVKSYSVTDGLVEIVREKIDEAVDDMLTGQTLSDQTKTFINHYSLADVVSTLAVLKRYYLLTNPSTTDIPTYDSALDNISTYIALYIISDLILEGKRSLEANVVPDAFQKAHKDNIDRIRQNLKDAEESLHNLIIRYQDTFEKFKVAHKTYMALKSEANRLLQNEIGTYIMRGK